MIDLIWFFVVVNSWLFSSPAGKLEGEIFGKLYVWRLLAVLCGLGSIGLKVVTSNQGFTGWLMFKLTQEDKEHAYKPLDN